jgi:outer membrane protein OmpA-like peptidoglycan-associated protein
MLCNSCGFIVSFCPWIRTGFWYCKQTSVSNYWSAAFACQSAACLRAVPSLVDSTRVRDNGDVAGYAAVLVDNRDLVRLVVLRERESGVLNLTTMLPNQDRALIHVYLVNGRNRILAHTFDARNLLRDGRRPEIVVSGHLREALHVTLRIDGEMIATTTIQLPQAITRWNPWPLVFRIAGLAAIALVGWGVWQLVSGVISGGDRLVRAAGESMEEVDSLATEGASVQAETGSPSTDTAAAAAERPATDEAVAEPEASVQPEAVAPESASPVSQEALLAEPAVPAEQPPEESTTQPVAPPAAENVIRTRTEVQEYTVYFTPESAEIISSTAECLDQIADSHPDGQVEIVASGHTALYDSEASRQALSELRAQAVAEYLRRRFEENRSAAEVSYQLNGFGGTRPVTRDEADQWRNRRVEITLTLTTTR